MRQDRTDEVREGAPPPAMPRVVFANHLRGIAALCVVLSHLVGVFWAQRDFVGLATSTPVQAGAPPPIFVIADLTWFQLGPFGVALFFLISGFVVPFSLQNATRAGFLVARILRIYPTYLAASSLSAAVLYAASWYWGKPFPYGTRTLALNALLVHNLFGHPGFDLVNWTLSVELKFYLLLAVVAGSLRRGGTAAPFAVAALICAANFLLFSSPAKDSLPDYRTVLEVFGLESPLVVFMLAGVLFNYRLRGLLGPGRLALLVTGMVVLFLSCWGVGRLRSVLPPAAMVNYAYALGLFSVLFWQRRRIPDVRVLGFLAAVSYPLYLVHCIIGFVALKAAVLLLGLPYDMALALVLGGVLALALLLHRSVELGSMSLGRRLSRLGGSVAVRAEARA